MFLTVTENKFIVWNYRFSGLTSIYLFEFSNINKVRNMFKVNNRSTRRSGVFIVNFEYIRHVVLVFFADFEHANDVCTTYSLNINLSMHFRVGSRSPVTFKSKLCVKAVNNSFQPLPIFCHKDVHVGCSILLKLDIVTSTKRYWGSSLPSIECNLG